MSEETWDVTAIVIAAWDVVWRWEDDEVDDGLMGEEIARLRKALEASPATNPTRLRP